MGCAKKIWNAKCEENLYYTTFARKYYPTGTYAPVDQTTAQFKDSELTPYLYDCPSHILRNSASNWYQTYRKFIKGQCGKPKIKKRSARGSIHLTSELFQFIQGADGVTRLFIGLKTRNIGFLSFKVHRQVGAPKSIYITKDCDRYSISFCYQDDTASFEQTTTQQHLDYLKGSSEEFLEEFTVGIDRGVAVPIQAGEMSYDFSDGQKRNKLKAEKHIKRLQKRLARQDRENKKSNYRGSKRRNLVRHKIARSYRKMANIRRDFCHATSKSLVDSSYKVIVLESLNTINMTRRAKAKPDGHGGYLKNQAAAKSGLNAAILDKGWHLTETMLRYKTQRAGKALFLVPAHHTSQECANCSHTHPENRQTQAKFACLNCGHTDNADRNASIIIKKRAINLLLDSGTELSKRGVLTLPDTGRGSYGKSVTANGRTAQRKEASKKKAPSTACAAA